MRRRMTTITRYAWMMIAVLAALAFAPPGGACAETGGPGLRVSWNAPRGVTAEELQGYNVYRSGSPSGGYSRVNDTLVAEAYYDDRGLVAGNTYYYRVTAVFEDGTESKPTDPIGMKAGTSGGAAVYTLPKADFFTSNALGRVMYAQDEVIFVLKSSPGLSVRLSVPGVVDGIDMVEAQPGTYKCIYVVERGVNEGPVYAEAVMTDSAGGMSSARTPATMNFIGMPAPSLAGVYVGVLEADRVGLNWPAYEGFEGAFSVYRDVSPLMDLSEHFPIVDGLGMDVNAYMDTTVNPETTYYYVLAIVDGEGWITGYSDNLEVTVPHSGRVSGIEYVNEDSGGRTLIPGDVLKVTMKTAPGGKAGFSLGEAARDVPMEESEDGLYTGSYTVREGDGVFSSRVQAGFRDSGGKAHFLNSATFVSVDAPALTLAAGSGVKPVIQEVEDDVALVSGSSGRLVAGRTFTVTMLGDPGCTAFFNVGTGIWKVPMGEDAQAPGRYKGSYTVRPGDNAGTSGDPDGEVYITAYLAAPDGTLSDPAETLDPVVIDTSCTILVDADADYLPADGKSRTGVTIQVTDADGEPVPDRRFTLLVEPPEDYTGIIGGGGLLEGAPSSETGDYSLGVFEADFDDMTDMNGELKATYTSGYAAKTAMVVVRDYMTGSVGMDYVRTGISSTVSVTLEDPALSDGPVTETPVYELLLDFTPEEPLPDEVSLPWFVLDAVPDKLTADGRSRASVAATLTKDGVPVEGMDILFSVMGAPGTFTKYSDRTDAAGMAQTFFIAGTKAGLALITATEAETGVTVTRYITLLADAPAVIYARAHPDTIPADGISFSELSVELADVNGNPVPGSQVSFEAAPGFDGMLSDVMSETDERGFCSVELAAGYVPGVAVINVSAVSPEPGPDYLELAAGRVVAPMVYDNDPLTELRVLVWYKQVGDYVGAGEPLVVLDTPLGRMTVRSPATGILDGQTIIEGMKVMEGKEIGIVSKD